jgi:hypothetical protein
MLKTGLKTVFAVSLIFLLVGTGCSKAESVRTPEVKRLEINGHDYLVIWNEANYGQTYLHDPDCKHSN